MLAFGSHLSLWWHPLVGISELSHGHCWSRHATQSLQMLATCNGSGRRPSATSGL